MTDPALRDGADDVREAAGCDIVLRVLDATWQLVRLPIVALATMAALSGPAFRGHWRGAGLPELRVACSGQLADREFLP